MTIGRWGGFLFLQWNAIDFSRHAIQRMFERAIRPEEVRETVCQGEVIASYPDDEPLPSMLVLGFAGGRPIHVVIARDEDTGTGHVITAYIPDPVTWSNGFRERNSQ